MPLDVEPQFKMSLTRSEMTSLGRFTAVWGQLDYWLSVVLTKLLCVDLGAGDLMLRNLTTGPRIALLRNCFDRITDQDALKVAKEFCNETDQLVGKRNHIVHGFWAWQLIDKTTVPACYSTRKPNQPIYPDELRSLTDKAALLTYKIHELFCMLANTELPSADNPNPRWVFSVENGIPDFLQGKLSESLLESKNHKENCKSNSWS